MKLKLKLNLFYFRKYSYVIFILLCNLILLNLIIAIFNIYIEKIKEKRGQKYVLFINQRNKYELTIETTLPPPLNLFINLFRIICILFCFKNFFKKFDNLLISIQIEKENKNELLKKLQNYVKFFEQNIINDKLKLVKDRIDLKHGNIDLENEFQIKEKFFENEYKIYQRLSNEDDEYESEVIFQ